MNSATQESQFANQRRWVELCVKAFLDAPDSFLMERAELAMKAVLRAVEARRRMEAK